MAKAKFERTKPHCNIVPMATLTMVKHPDSSYHKDSVRACCW